MSTAINGPTPTNRSQCGEDLGIALAIVWRNPHSLIRAKRTVQRVQSDQFEVVYAATDPNGTQEFRLESGERMAG
jgi:hypothetical protein